MSIKLGVIMDPIISIHYKKDSTLAMLWEAERRGFEIFYMEQKDLFLRDGKPFGSATELKVFHDEKNWFSFGKSSTLALTDLNIILVRKDPPFDSEYIYMTYILEMAEQAGVIVANKPQSLRDANEKVYTAWFPQCSPKTLIAKEMNLFREFLREEKDIILKPLNAMGGYSIFRVKEKDENASVILEVLTEKNTRYAMAQTYIPEIKSGDKRILLINGEAIPYALARIPAQGELRGNLAAGAKGVAQPLSKKDLWICEQIGPTLKEKGLIFVGIDVIGDYLTEINVTSPTGIRELDEQCQLNIASQLMDSLEKMLRFTHT